MERIHQVTRLVSIDPGSEHAGYAIWTNKLLGWCGLVDTWGSHIQGSKCVCELPRIYPGGKTKRPNDIIILAISAGRLTQPWDKKDVSWVPPRTWKGQVEDDILYDRIRGFLDPLELDTANRACANLSKSVSHNVWDAIGLGLYHLKRMGVAGTF
jgi:hypothetical protein